MTRAYHDLSCRILDAGDEQYCHGNEPSEAIVFSFIEFDLLSKELTAPDSQEMQGCWPVEEQRGKKGVELRHFGGIFDHKSLIAAGCCIGRSTVGTELDGADTFI